MVAGRFPPRTFEQVTRTMTTLTQQELEARLWEAANCLRGPVDPADFKAYVFPVLFFKWISDTWDTEHAEAVADFGEDVSAEEEADYHRFMRTRPRTAGPDRLGRAATVDVREGPARRALPADRRSSSTNRPRCTRP